MESQYRPSTNLYWEKIKSLNRGIQAGSSSIQERVFTDEDTEHFKGQWRSRFAPSSSSPIHVEIGCNGGHVILKWAEQNPNTLFVGIDWKFKQIYLAYEKAKKRGLTNVIFLRAHATRLPLIFGPGEISSLFLFFPDPWRKRAQQQNRFIQVDHLREIHPLLAKDGIFHIKTDHAEYFDWMEKQVSQVQDLWQVQDRTVDLHADCVDPLALEIPAVTLFEKIFIRDGIPIKSMKLARRPKP